MPLNIAADVWKAFLIWWWGCSAYILSCFEISFFVISCFILTLCPRVSLSTSSLCLFSCVSLVNRPPGISVPPPSSLMLHLFAPCVSCVACFCLLTVFIWICRLIPSCYFWFRTWIAPVLLSAFCLSFVADILGFGFWTAFTTARFLLSIRLPPSLHLGPVFL